MAECAGALTEKANPSRGGGAKPGASLRRGSPVAKEASVSRSAVSSAAVDRPPIRTGPVDAVELEDLWRRYRASGDAGARERLVIAYAHLARRVARQLSARMPPHVEEADLISSGLGGLISAIEPLRPRRTIRLA